MSHQYTNNKKKVGKHIGSDKVLVTSLLDEMKSGREYESLLNCRVEGFNFTEEIRRSLKEIESIRQRPIICYACNIINQKLTSAPSIDDQDDLPFSELLSTLDTQDKYIDVVLITGGGSGQQVQRFVERLRRQFDDVSFILPYKAMSAGTMFIMSGDEIVMGPNSCFGPIDPQFIGENGQYFPGQALINLIEVIRDRGAVKLNQGQDPDWTDLQILSLLDYNLVGHVHTASDFSRNLVEDYLYRHKFKNWKTHIKSGTVVTDSERKQVAEKIAKELCNHRRWNDHGSGININTARELGLLITSTEDIPNLENAVRRFWALLHWIFEFTSVAKLYISNNYCVARSEQPQK